MVVAAIISTNIAVALLSLLAFPAGTPFDFTIPYAIGARIQKAGGYDHNYVLFGMGPQARFIVHNGIASSTPRLAATVTDPRSGRTLDVLTTAPGMQLYTGNYLDGRARGKGGAKYPKHGGFCLVSDKTNVLLCFFQNHYYTNTFGAYLSQRLIGQPRPDTCWGCCVAAAVLYSQNLTT